MLVSSCAPLALDLEIERLVAANAPIAFSTSGGKDSAAAALATSAYLDAVDHHGPRIVVHADLGRVEWRASATMCAQLAAHLGIELITVQRGAGDLLARWQSRWASSVQRYAQLETVTLIMPWSSAALRFCTSESKVAPITAALARRFTGQNIITVMGIRRQESAARAKAPIARPQPRLDRHRAGTSGYDWHPIIEWNLDEVYAAHRVAGFPLHEAYTHYGTTRVSCCFCILGSQADLLAATTCAENHDVYRALVDLEITSRFAFQQGHWLGDLAPALLPARQRLALARAKRCAQVRERAEARIPSHLRYTTGWPTVRPTHAEATLLADVRRTVAEVSEIAIDYHNADAIEARYDDLMKKKAVKI